MVGNILGNSYGNTYDIYSAYNQKNTELENSQDGSDSVNKANVHTVDEAQKAGMSEAEIKALKRSGTIECETCASRKYQDGSNEAVSFKSASHVAPEAASSAVRAHEQEHVANAYNKAEQNNGQVLQASVAIHTSTCPECGRTYVSGGTTTTQIKYNSDNPYAQNAKSQDATSLIGQSLDLTA